ncbi:sigma-70 family RNA polymerase sigma factor [Phycisphaera mikurensis]|uniref:RNA polymerase sigma factor n=1 Tax=Phycisphaera mikurensis (strain NBRC 102666 / KCTC 22515 / FYK2301M01) TaxID=1142394 RepID=I0IG70_PHYMF|nr:sigma-70 family RNA polymerase sigma factor [Phycisphaera mikurensis]MBB6440359.1 RNA polymerase sigma-70 factor (ECF subfamily) [Phycisphaera mikurensis]BAM04258.1 RNA polymerase ECF-type sigma factor [Phycisphaera mikurensis NBRC 102666]
MPPEAPSTTDPPASPERWLDDHGDALYRYARSRERDDHRAEDLVQETLLAAWAGRDGYAGVAAERAWLMGILRHKVVDEIRRNQRRPTEALPEGEDVFFDRRGRWKRRVDAWGVDPSAAMHEEDFHRVVDGCRAELPETLGEVFFRRYSGDEGVSEIAASLRVTAGSVSVRLHRARLAMRACLALRWLGGGGG